MWHTSDSMRRNCWTSSSPAGMYAPIMQRFVCDGMGIADFTRLLAASAMRFARNCAVITCCLCFAFAASAQRAYASPQNASSSISSSPGFTIVIDAAHGGSDTGAKLSPKLDEKTVTLTMADHLRALLAAHGVSVVMTRTNDTNISMDTRAEIANHAHAAACLILHATASGTGVHLFTSSLSPAPPTAAPAWTSAQAGYVRQSIRLSSDIDAALTHTTIPVIVGRTFLQPLDHLTCPAVAIELAPDPDGSLPGGESVNHSSYQSTVLNAIVAGILQWQQDWSRKP